MKILHLPRHCLLALLLGTLHAGSPPELAVLSQQYEKALATTVTGPFQQALATLNAKYLGGLDRAIAEAKSAGKLEDILTIEAEKKRIADATPIPAEDDESTPASLKKLRGIYREQMAKIEEVRATAQLPLVTALVARLKTLETTLTKSDRIDEAKEVLAYREALAAGQPPMNEPAPAADGPSKPSAPAQPADSGPTLSAAEASRQLVEWSVQNGHVATVNTAKASVEVRTAADIPKEAFDLVKIGSLDYDGFKEPPPWRLFQFTPNVTFLWISQWGPKGEVQPQDVGYLRFLKKLKDLELTSSVPQDIGPIVDAMPEMPALTRLVFTPQATLESKHLVQLTSRYPHLRYFAFKAKVEFTDEAFALLSNMKQLVGLRFDRLAWTLNPAKIAVLAKMPALHTLNFFDLQTNPLDGTAPKHLTNIKNVEVHYNVQGVMQSLGALPAMENLFVRNTASLTDADLETLAPAAKLKSLHFENTPKITDQGLSSIVKRFPNLEKLRLIKCSGITPQGLAVIGGLKKLTLLNLSETPAATDAILPVIENLNKLADLALKEAPLSENALKSFQKKRRDIKIIR